MPASGSARSRLLIVGLAPGRQGANRTGRVFVGDASGRFLFKALHNCGLASDPDPFNAHLNGVRMTNVLKCWPPGNSPKTDELARCGQLLAQELALFWHSGVRQPRGILCLGRIAYERTRMALRPLLPAAAQIDPKFVHGEYQWPSKTLKLIASYHPSAQNVNTGRLNPTMLEAAIKQLLELKR